MSHASTTDTIPLDDATPSGHSIVAAAPAPLSDPLPPITFRSFDPARGEHHGPTIHAAPASAVSRAAELAADAFIANRARPRADHAAFLDRIAANIASLGDTLVQQACRETGLPAPRIASERDRTVFQLRLFASLLREGSWVDAIIDHADPSRTPLPKPDLRRMLHPLGPVAVFGASNFPLAYSVAGGDTASALAAGCPVVVKGHAAHPLTGEMVARAIAHAVHASSLHPGTFSFLHAGATRDLDVGKELLLNPHIRAVGFTGSVPGGSALIALAAQRVSPHGGGPDPIPVFAEMGSVNPVVILPGAIASESAALDVAAKLAASAVNSSGQMCTCPGLLFLIDSDATAPHVSRFIDALARGMQIPGVMPMLTPRTRDLLEQRRSQVSSTPGVRLLTPPPTAAPADPTNPPVPITTHATLYDVRAADFIREPRLAEECFGPCALVVRCADDAELLALLHSALPGSLTGSLFAAPADQSLASRVRDHLVRRVGRFIYNGVPTGVDVAAAMVHSGPFPACNRPDSSAVGATAIRRWCRPVCYQNLPDDMLPPELREANPAAIHRTIDGVPTPPIPTPPSPRA